MSLTETNCRLCNGGLLIVGSKDDLEWNYGAELEGPYGLAWVSPDGRMLVWSYPTRDRARAAAFAFRGKAVDEPRIEFL